MEVLYDRVAGLDVGKASVTVTVTVRTPGARRGRHQETRTFRTTTGSLLVMREWLLSQGVTIAAMESTSTYWKPPFYCLEEVMEVWLLNAAHMKAVPGRKTDVRDAEWIAQLLEHGLLTGHARLRDREHRRDTLRDAVARHHVRSCLILCVRGWPDSLAGRGV